MKTIVLTTLCLLLLLFACSDDDGKEIIHDPPGIAAEPDLVTEIPSPEDLEQWDGLIAEDVLYGNETVVAHPLTQFVEYDFPQLYVYEVMSDDNDGNWSPRLRGMDDLTWQEISEGYLVPEMSYRAYFTSDDIAGTYNVKSLGYLNLYRTIEVIKDGTVTCFQVGAFEEEMIGYRIGNDEYFDVPAIPLTHFISDYVTTRKENFTYLLEDVQGNDNLYQWHQIENAYLLDEQVLFLSGAENIVTNEENYPASITLIKDARF